MDLLQFMQLLAYPKLKHDAREYLRYSANGGRLGGAERKLHALSKTNVSPQISLGRSDSGQPIRIPLDDFCQHGLICGATGSGKSFCALSLMTQLLEFNRKGEDVSFGLIDAKGELFQRLGDLVESAGLTPDDVAILDFSSGSDPVPYTLLKPRQGETPELLVDRRMEVFSDVLGREGSLSLRMSRMLRCFLLLLLEAGLSFPILEFLFSHPEIACRMAAKSKNERMRSYFESDFAREQNTTLPALSGRLDFLLRNEMLRLSFGADEFVDFRDLMDRGVPVLINCGGPGMPRSISRLIQSLVVSDLRAIFSRKNPRHHYSWFIDEAQCLFSQSTDTENLSSIFSLSRSYRTYLILVTQSLSSAIPDRGFFTNLETNFGWIVLFRSGLQDAEVIVPGLPVTGKLVGKVHERGRVTYLSPEQEIRHRLREITSLPSQTAYFWLRGSGANAVRMKSHRVTLARGHLGRTRSYAQQAVDSRELKARLEAQEQKLRQLAAAPARREGRKKKTNVVDILTRLDKELEGEADHEE